MHQIDNASVSENLPAKKAAGTGGYFSGGDGAAGKAGTVVEADWLNTVQEELKNVVVAAGVELDKSTDNQLLTAINALIAAGTPSTDSAPTGAIFQFPGSAAPTGWLFCAGQEVSRTTYEDLFNLIGSTYGAGDGTTTFKVPDYRGRIGVGKDDMGGTAANIVTTAGSGIDGTVLGTKGGAEKHQLTKAQMPAHTHSVSFEKGYSQTGLLGSGDPAFATASIATGSEGGEEAHNNMQPSIVMNYIIKT